MPKPWVGGSKWNEYVASGRSAVKETRNVIGLLRDDIDELRGANDSDVTVLNFLLSMASRLDDASQRLDDVQSAFINLWEIGAQYKDQRTQGK